MTIKFPIAGTVALLLASISITAHAGVASWQTSTNANAFVNVSPTTSGLVFFRPANQNNKVNTGTNIAIDGQYLISLHDGHFASTPVCSGTHQVSAVPTGALSNDLRLASQNIYTPAQTITYIKVNVDERGYTTLEPLDDQAAKQALIGTPQQTHQISRVTTDSCQVAPSFTH